MKLSKAEYYIDEAAGEARGRYVSGGQGMESTYILKAQQAREFKEAGYIGDAPSFVAAEAYALGSTPQYATDYILYLQDQWLYVGAEIEKIRRKAKVDIAQLTDEEQIQIACENALQILNSI